MNNSKTLKIANILLAVILCFMFVVSVVDSKEIRHDTNFSQENMLTHVEKLSENGPRSIVDREENEMALQYLIDQVESYGVTAGDTTDAPAYMIQEYVASDSSDKYQNFYLKNLMSLL